MSLLSSSRFVPGLARMPTLLPPAKPEVRAGLDDAHVRPSPRGVGAAVGRRVVDDDDLVRRETAAHRGAIARHRSRSARALNDTMTIERSSVHRSRSAQRLACGARPAVLRERRRRRREQIRSRVGSSNSSARSRARVAEGSPRRDVQRGVAAALAGDGGVEQHRRHAGRQRLERRQARVLRTPTETRTRARGCRDRRAGRRSHTDASDMRSPSCSRSMAAAMSSKG